MSLTVKQAIHRLLTTRDSYTDSVRESGRKRFSELIGNNVWDARRPQTSGPIGVTIQRDGGLTHEALSGYAGCTQPAIEISVWLREGEENRTSDAEAAYQAAEDILLGFRGTVGGLTIHSITLDGEPFETTERPLAGQDQWVYHYQSSWLVAHAINRPAHNTSELTVVR